MTYAQRQRRKTLKVTAMTQALLDNWANLPSEYRKVLRRAGVKPERDVEEEK